MKKKWKTKMGIGWFIRHYKDLMVGYKSPFVKYRHYKKLRRRYEELEQQCIEVLMTVSASEEQTAWALRNMRRLVWSTYNCDNTVFGTYYQSTYDPYWD